MHKYLKTAGMSAMEKLNGGVIYLLPDVIIKAFTLIPLVFLWRVVMSKGVQTGMTLEQMLTYTYVSALLSDMLVVTTPATGWLSEGVIQKLYGRPLSVFGQLAAITAGGWAPNLLLFSLPLALLAPVFGISLVPASPLFFISLPLCMSLGFAIDMLFACLSQKLRNMSWLVNRIRAATVTLLSGTIIPISLLPYGVARILQYQPFASLGGSPLSIFTGAADSVGGGAGMILRQVIWNLVVWPAALLWYAKSREEMVSYGG